MKKPLLDYQTFLMGMKPALYGNTNSPTFRGNFNSFKHYPCVTEGIHLHDQADFFLFLQTESLKEDFLEKRARVKHLSPEFHELLGITLAYPPLAAKYFSELHRLEEVEKRLDKYKELAKYRVSFYYAGIRCSGHVKDLKTNSLWLWKKYTLADEVFKVGLMVEGIVKYFDVKPYDFAELEYVKQRKLETINQETPVI